MDVITQTNRTILFEEINPEKNDLLTLIGDVKGKSSLEDDKVKEINENLLVSSFDEFLDKFAPVVYSFFNANNQKVMYSLKKPENIPENCITEIPLNMENDFLKMLLTLISTKGAMGIANVDFKFDKILDMISPKKIMDDIRQSRKEIRYVYSQYEALDDGDPKKLDVGDKLNYMFEQASMNYNNVMAMLPLAIEDIHSIRQRENKLIVMGEEAEAHKWDVYMIRSGENRRFDRFTYPLTTNKRTDEFIERFGTQQGRRVRTNGELSRFIQGYGMEKYVEYEGYEILDREKNGESSETYSMNSFILDEIREGEYRKRLVLLFRRKGTQEFLLRDIMSFLVSEVQLWFGEYMCEGKLI